jgi:hypothetical protein
MKYKHVIIKNLRKKIQYSIWVYALLAIGLLQNLLEYGQMEIQCECAFGKMEYLITGKRYVQLWNIVVCDIRL